MFVALQFCNAQQETARESEIKQRLISLQTAQWSDCLFEELLEIYAKGNRFEELYSFLEMLENNRIYTTSPVVYYYKALTMFRQMQYLEENRMWEELFNNKDSYFEDLEDNLKTAKELATSVDPLTLKIELLEWLIERLDDEEAAKKTLEDLLSLSKKYINTGNSLQLIKDIADKLFQEAEPDYAHKLYDIYVSNISRLVITDEEIKMLAEGFLEKNEVDLSISLFDIYLEKVLASKKEKNEIINTMVSIGERFAHFGWKEGLDCSYAEKIYKKVENLYGAKTLDIFSQYARAYNLERLKDYRACVEEYSKLLINYPDYQDKDKIYFRIGILDAYVLNKIDEAKKYFLKVIDTFKDSIVYLNSMYQLGLLEHWSGNLDKAKEFYNKIIEATKDSKDKSEIASLTQTRMKEIEQNKEIEYNLRMFLDTALKIKEGETGSDLDFKLFAKPPKAELDNLVKFEITTFSKDTGSLQEAFAYLWSGDLGSNQEPSNKDQFVTSYQEPGIKIINVVLADLTKTTSSTLEIVDIEK
jgi:tetratricopeptide (TPR) repeat protein